MAKPAKREVIMANSGFRFASPKGSPDGHGSRTIASASAALATTASHGAQRAIGLAGHAVTVWRERRALRTLDDRLLNDLGLTRVEADREASRSPFDSAGGATRSYHGRKLVPHHPPTRS
ncbi:MAG: DUF1127 domain-containing protein [Pseudomonadota bacterium]